MVTLRGLFLFATVNVLTAVAFFGGGDFPHACCDSLLGSENLRIGNSFITGKNGKAADQDIVVDSFRINPEDGFLLMPVTLQGKRYKFVLDTGSSEGVYDTSFLSVLGDPIKTVKMHRVGLSDKLVSMYKSPEGYVGKIKLPKELDCFCMDLKGIREASGLEINGILGMDFLKKHILRIDFDQKEVAFLQEVGIDPGLKLPLVFRGNWPHVMVKYQEVPGERLFLVDTGCVGLSSGSILEETFVELEKKGIIKVEQDEGKVETISGSQERRLGYVREFSVDIFHHKQLLFNESKKNILGLGYWSRYVVTLDFPNSAIYLKKGEQFDRPDLSNMSGLGLCRRQGQTVVVTVLKESPADHAGIKLDDVLLKIDEVNTSEMSLYRIGRMLCGKDKESRLIVRRGAQELKLTISLPR